MPAKRHPVWGSPIAHMHQPSMTFICRRRLSYCLQNKDHQGNAAGWPGVFMAHGMYKKSPDMFAEKLQSLMQASPLA